MNILFVCTGNTCRSPTAAILLREKAAQLGLKMGVQSAGIATIDGLPLSTNAALLLEERNLNTAHRSQMLTDELVQWADLILTMTAGHKRVLDSQFPFAKEKTYTLVEYALKDEVAISDLDIIDPFGGDVNLYLQVTTQLETCIDKLIDNYLQQKKSGDGESKKE